MIPSLVAHSRAFTELRIAKQSLSPITWCRCVARGAALEAFMYDVPLNSRTVAALIAPTNGACGVSRTGFGGAV